MNTILQMTWSYEWNFSDKHICPRGTICHRPHYSGEFEPNVTTNAGSCKLQKGEVCVKQVVYDALDSKTPKFIARTCGRGHVTNDGSRPTTSCHVDRRRRDRVVQVCFCNDGDRCNASPTLSTSMMLHALSTLVTLIVSFHLM